jgi:protein-disulfide isomerase
MNNVNSSNSKSNLPLLIIGAVLLAAIAGGWWFYSNSKTPPVKTATNSANSNAGNKQPPVDQAKALQDAYNNAPSGAQPANMLGSPTATVTVEEFADYQCPTCATVHPMTQELTKIYGNRIKFVYRNFPLQQIHRYAYDAAVAAEAASLQGKFWEMQNQLFQNQREWSSAADAPKLFEGYAQKIGLDIPKYQNDILGLGAKSRVDADMMRGRRVGVGGTPAIYINGVPVDFSKLNVEAMRQIIDSELQKAGSQATRQTANQPTTSNQSTNTAVVVNNNATNNAVGNSIEKK